ncbi:uncharacterized protein A1O5_07408 [Cladophialophora psammophila CBS 110553]|uniref:Uncharacterized protein n=1 Tax=Cladophialophora psammophila CBS 110553 TaxID=1182543 RepID=W9WMJ2_9EURO|nr:uncharacterized protein A1O5_07408 [Cladophialophora psammophila CBS 110553]EXJ69372.1 hypothetical protein A1O5_07408 [Cladophialophora psammophila CBS 110553]
MAAPFVPGAGSAISQLDSKIIAWNDVMFPKLKAARKGKKVPECEFAEEPLVHPEKHAVFGVEDDESRIEEDTGQRLDVKEDDEFGQFLEDRGVEMVSIDPGLELPLAQIDVLEAPHTMRLEDTSFSLFPDDISG